MFTNGFSLVFRHPSVGEGAPAAPSTPDTTLMDKSDYRKRVLWNSGDDISYLADVPYGSVPLCSLQEFRPLKPHEKVKLSQQFVPNCPSQLICSEEKLFCGLHR
jgi:hypothetical protein